MTIKIVCTGKNKNDGSKLLIDDYLKRIKPYADVQLVFLRDTSLSKSGSVDIVIKEESKRIIEYIKAGRKVSGKQQYFIVLDRSGTMLDSIQFSGMLGSLIQHKEPVFIIGGVYGISDEVKQVSDVTISLSLLTFNHLLTRAVLLEQIYRSFTIINNKKYHY